MNYTKILEVSLFAFAYRLFHEDFFPINGRRLPPYWLCDKIKTSFNINVT